MKTDAAHIKSCLSEHDIFIVDRWFSDALPMLKDLGIQAEILRCLEKGQKQMSIGDTNKSRPVTKVRNLKKIMVSKHHVIYTTSDHSSFSDFILQ